MQERRIQNFHLQSEFKAVEIVETKTQNTFLQYCEKHDVDMSKSWMVGDSLNSDIIPALSVGLKAIHVLTRNWHPVEGSAADLPEGVLSVDSVLDIRKHLL